MIVIILRQCIKLIFFILPREIHGLQLFDAEMHKCNKFQKKEIEKKREEKETEKR